MTFERVEIRSLPQIALDVHMTTTGAYERSEDDQQADLRELRRRFALWKPTRGVAFDNCVLTLLIEAIREAECKQ